MMAELVNLSWDPVEAELALAPLRSLAEGQVELDEYEDCTVARIAVSEEASG